MPLKNPPTTTSPSESRFTFEIDAKVLGQGIDLKATQEKKSGGQKASSKFSINGVFDPSLKPLTKILEFFGFNDGESPLKILEKVEIKELEAIATQEDFTFSVNQSISFKTLKQTDKSKPTKLVFTFDLGDSGKLTFPKNIPVIQDALSDPDTFLIQLSKIVIATADIPDEKDPAKDIKKGLQIQGKVKFFSYEQDIVLYLFQPGKSKVKKPPQIGSNITGAVTDNEVQLQADTEPAVNDSTKWINIQKTIGPITLEKVGFQFNDGKIWFLINLSFKLSGFDLSLQGFRLGFPPKFPPEVPSFGLDGIGLSLKKGSIQVAGAFLKAPDIPNYYSGFALVKTPTLSIDAFGGYGQLPDNQGPAIFIFASLNMPIGGPAFFFVTGFSLGFGYNTAFKIPSIDEVTTFPLLNTSVFNSAGNSPTAALAKLNKFIYPEPDNIWFAVGISFTSFKLIDSRALLVIDIGKEQISILGMSVLVLPQMGKAFIDIKLGLVVFLKIREGIFQARAKIANGSFILDPSCKVFGEFAFFAWFKGQYKGDFVLSIGGYHPRFKKPAQYPDVQRVGFEWKVSNKLQILGNVYFALTPSAVMAGFRFEATFKAGPIKAWFIALANFLIQWKPFYYDIEVGISIGVSFKIFRIELSAYLHIYGPPVGGKAKITWWVVSFTIRFGASLDSKPTLLSWDKFDENFLPGESADKETSKRSKRNSRLRKASQTEPKESEVCRATIVGGLLRTFGEEDNKTWIVRADELLMTTETVIPAFEFHLNGELAIEPEDLPDHDPIGVRPMGLRELTLSKHEVSISYDGTLKLKNAVGETPKWHTSIATNGVPAALWDTIPVDPKVPNAKTLKAMVGFGALAPMMFIPPDIPVTWIKNFAYVNIVKKSPLKSKTDAIAYDISARKNTIKKIARGIPATTQKRLAMIDTINDLYGLKGDLKIIDNLNKFPSEIDAYFQSEPMIGRLIETPDGSVAQDFKDIIIPPTPPVGPEIDPDFFLQKALRIYNYQSIANYTAVQQLIIEKQLHDRQPMRLNAFDGADYLFAINNPKKFDIYFSYIGSSKYPLSVYYYNASFQILDYQLIDSKVSKVTIPKNTHQLSYSSFAEIDSSLNVCGWTTEFKMPFINSLTIKGKQILLKPQAPYFKDNDGLVVIPDLLNENKYLGDENKIYKGWIDTEVYANNPKEIVFLFQKIKDGISLKKAIKASIPYVILENAQGKRSYEKIELTTETLPKKVDEFYRIRFKLPLSKLPKNRLGIALRIQVKEEAQENWNLQGALVLCSTGSIKEEEWLNPELPKLSNPFSSKQGADVPTIDIQFTKIK